MREFLSKRLQPGARRIAALRPLAQGVLLLTLVASSMAAHHRPSKLTASSALPSGVMEAMRNVKAEHISADVRFLSSDLLEGRGTGARGGDIAAEYIATQFAIAGLEPAGDNGTFMQKVPMVGITTLDGTTLSISTPKQKMSLRMLDDAVVVDESQQAVSDINADVLFVGYGINAPEFAWNDYAGVDVKGKVLLMLVNEPPSNDPKFFAGRALTYYGRWTYKYEQAARMGAAGVILIHKTEMASYDWSVVRNSWSGERSMLAHDQSPKLHMASWIQLELARTMLADCGKNLDELIKAAGQRGFKPEPLPLHVQSHIVNKVRPFQSNNVIAKLTGSDPKLKDQGVFFTAHYDHLGYRPEMPGNNIYHGALDNASGTAMVMEMARAAAAAKQRPKRTLYFAAVTAEEQGLWGSEYLGQHPPIPASQIALNINFDSIAPLGIPREVSAEGYERTTFAPVFEKTASDFAMKILPAEEPEAGGYYRSDHFSFARQGVPAFSVNNGSKFDGHPEAWIKQRSEQMTKSYHQPTDEWHADDDYRANAVFARFGLALGYRAADAPSLVQWKSGDEFEARRLAQLKRM